jgi:hypothetical protein
MADVNQASQEMAEVIAQVSDDLRRFGRVTEDTQAALAAGSFRRAKELDKASALTAGALGNLAGAGLAAGKAMYDGQKGAAAFNSSLDSMSKAVTAAGAALTFLVPGGFLIKALIGLGTAAVGASIKMTQAANDMADNLFAANTKMAKAGLAGSDGMMGIFRDAKKLGLSMKELGVYTNAVAANSAELALFKGTAFEGRQAFADIGAAMKPFRASLEGAGISLEDQIAGTAGYLRLQTQIGQSQNKSTTELANGARKYLVEMDGLSKLTGMQREEMEKQMEAARSEQRFRAKLDAMRSSGDAKQIAAADKMERANILISKQAPELGQAFRDASSGVLTSDAAVKGLIGTQGKLLQVTDQLANGQIDEYQTFKQLGQAAGQFGKDMNFTAQLGLLNDFSIDYAQAMKIGIATTKDTSELAALIAEEQKKQMGSQNDANTKAMADLREKQRNINEMLETTVSKQMGTAIAMSSAMADATKPIATAFDRLQPLMATFIKQMTKLTEFLAEKLGWIVGKTVDVVEAAIPVITNAQKASVTALEGVAKVGGTSSAEVAGTAGGAAVGAGAGAIAGGLLGVLGGPAGMIAGAKLGAVIGTGLGSWIGQNLGNEAGKNVAGRAAGGPVSRRNPYIVGERGPELMVPEQAGKIINNDKLSKMFESMASSVSSGQVSVDMISQVMGSSATVVTTTNDKLTDNLKTTQNVGSTYQAILRSVDELNDKTKKTTESAITAQRETLTDIQRIERYTDQDTKRTKDFVDFHKKYLDSITQILGENLELLQEQSEQSGSAGAGGAPVMGRGTGLKIPAAPPAGGMGGGSGVSAGGGQGIKAANENDLLAMGLKFDPKRDVQAEGAAISPKLIELAKNVQNLVPGFSAFTGLNDQFHNEKSPNSLHTKGQAMDFVLNKKPTREEGASIVSWLKQSGASLAIDEYNNASKNATGGHFHAQIPAFGDGGMVDKATLALIGEKGPEAVIPMDGKEIPLNISKPIPIKLDFKDVMAEGGIGPTFAGSNEYTGYNQGGMTTDLSAVKEIAASMGAFDKATQTITDPATWKEILNSGIAMNYDLGMITVGSKMVDGLAQEMGQRLNDIVAENGVSQKEAFDIMRTEFVEAMKSTVTEMFRDVAGKTAAPENDALLAGIDALIAKQSEANDISKKILQVSAN